MAYFSVEQLPTHNVLSDHNFFKINKNHFISNILPIIVQKFSSYVKHQCCIVALPEESLICKKDITLEKFITKRVLPYFHNQLFRELNGYFLNERSHENEGIREFFLTKFNTHDFKKNSQWLLFIGKKKELERTANCFFGNGKKIWKMYRNLFREFVELLVKHLIYYSLLLKN